MDKKISIIVGHEVNGRDKGAVNYLGEAESTYNLRIANKLKFKLYSKKVLVDIYLRDNTTYKKIASKIKESGSVACIELHFNSFSKPSYGCECLAIDGDAISIKFADVITDKISQLMKIGQRNKDGVLRIGKGGRGYLNLKIIKDNALPKYPVVLVEPCFANIKTMESQKFFENEDMYVDSLVQAVLWLLPEEQKISNSDKNNFLGDNMNIKDYEKSPKNIIEALSNFFNTNYK